MRHLGPSALRAYATLREQILQHVYQPGERLPSRSDLALSLGVGTKTVAQVCAVLEDEGLVRTEWGHGTFVSRRMP